MHTLGSEQERQFNGQPLIHLVSDKYEPYLHVIQISRLFKLSHVRQFGLHVKQISSFLKVF